MARQALDAVAEQLEPHLALDAMRPGDRGERDPALATVADAANYSAFSSVSAWGESSVGGFDIVRAFGRGFVSRSLVGDSLFGRRFAGVGLGDFLFLAGIGLAAASSATTSSAGVSSAAASATGASSPASASAAASSATGSSAGTSAVSAGACSAATSLVSARRGLLGDLVDDLLGLGGRLGGRGFDFSGDHGFGLFLLSFRGRLFGRRIGGGFGFGGLLRALLDALLGLLARLRLLAGCCARAARGCRRHRGSAARGPTAARRRSANARCGRRRASRAPANPWPAADCRCRASR